MMSLEGVNRFCFAASYSVALGFELARLFWPRKALRWLGLGFSLAGLLAQSIYLGMQLPPLATQAGSLLLLSWVLAIFSVYGTLHYAKAAWSIFTLPLVLAFIGLAELFLLGRPPLGPNSWLDALRGERFWGIAHGSLLLLAAVGVCVGFLASVMYLIQAGRLKAKLPPLKSFALLSLERLENMNRRAINAAFPLLTAGLLVGVALMLHRGESLFAYSGLKFIVTWGLWLVFLVLLVLRYSLHARGRWLAIGTVVAFGLLVVILASAHPIAGVLP